MILIVRHILIADIQHTGFWTVLKSVRHELLNVRHLKQESNMVHSFYLCISNSFILSHCKIEKCVITYHLKNEKVNK